MHANHLANGDTRHVTIQTEVIVRTFMLYIHSDRLWGQYLLQRYTTRGRARKADSGFMEKIIRFTLLSILKQRAGDALYCEQCHTFFRKENMVMHLTLVLIRFSTPAVRWPCITVFYSPICSVGVVSNNWSIKKKLYDDLYRTN